jgi:large subunit ribosomal protein L25
MKQVAFDAYVRTERGKGAARQLRRAGSLPAVLYGPKTEPISISLDAHEFNKIMSSSHGEQILFTLKLKNNGDSGNFMTLIKELQLHPVNDAIRHVDFYQVSLDEEVEVEIPIAIVGKAKGVEIEEGVLEIIQRTVRVSCLPMAIPREIQVDVSNLGVGDASHVSDVVPLEGVRLLEDPKTTLVTVVGGAVQEEAVTEEEVEVEEEGV